MKKFIFISLAKTHNNMIERFYLDILYENCLDVEYWDLRAIFYDENPKSEFVFIQKLYSIKEFHSKLLSLDKENVILNLQFSYEFKYLKLFLLTKNFTRTFYSIGNFPQYQVNPKRDFILKIKKVFSKRVFEKMIEVVFQKIFLKDLDICFYAGEYSKNITKAKKYLPINYIDYERQRIFQPEEKDFQYVVFLDLNITRHPDFKEMGIEYIDETIYFNQLKELFKNIETQMGFKVLIALHPTSNGLEFHPSELQYKHRVNELIANCEFVVTHYSTSICTAISAFKPLLLIITEEMIEKIPHAVATTYGYAHALSLEVINLDDQVNIKNLPSIKTEQYNSFLSSYYTSEIIKNKNACDYFIEYLKEL